MKRLLNLFILGLLLIVLEHLLLNLFLQFETWLTAGEFNGFSQIDFRHALEISSVRFLFYLPLWIVSMSYLFPKFKFQFGSIQFSFFNLLVYISSSLLMCFPFPGAIEFFTRNFFVYLVMATFLSPILLSRLGVNSQNRILKRGIIGLGVFIFLCGSCKSQEKEMTNTKWVFHYEECQDYVKTKEYRQYEFYSCESGETTYGEYSFKNDTLVLIQLKGDYDDSFDNSSKHRTPTLKFKLVLDQGKLKFVERWELNTQGEWYKSNFVFPTDYVFSEALPSSASTTENNDESSLLQLAGEKDIKMMSMWSSNRVLKPRDGIFVNGRTSCGAAVKSC